MKRYKVRLLVEADEQIDELTLFNARDSVERALKWADRLRGAIEAIGDHPGYAVDPEATERMGRETRKMTFERTYLVFFHVSHEERAIYIVNVRHGARLPRGGEP